VHLAASQVVEFGGFQLIRNPQDHFPAVHNRRDRGVYSLAPSMSIIPAQAGIHKVDHRRLTRDEVVLVWRDYLRYYRLTMTVLSSVKVSIA
jgi:hypothetical protein